MLCPSASRYASSCVRPDGGGDVVRAVGRELLDGDAGERVDEPRLPLREFEGVPRRVGFEALPRLRGVLRVELGHLVGGERAQRERAVDDVEGRRRVRAIWAARGDLVVPHVAHADEGERPGRAPWSVGVTVPELTQHGDEHVAFERVDLVEKEHQRTQRRATPRAERRAQLRPRRGLGPRRRLKLRREPRARTLSPRPEHGLLRGAHVARKGRAGLHRDEQRRVAPLGRERLREGAERRGLAHLPRRVQHEVRAVVDELAHAHEPTLRREHVVALGVTGPRGVEASRHRGRRYSMRPRAERRHHPPPRRVLRPSPHRP